MDIFRNFKVDVHRESGGKSWPKRLKMFCFPRKEASVVLWAEKRRYKFV